MLIDTITRTSTPTHVFSVPSDFGNIEQVMITYSQQNAIRVNRVFSGSEIENWKVTVKMTQQETKSFSPTGAIIVQERILTEDGDSFASNEVTMRPVDVANDAIMPVVQ